MFPVWMNHLDGGRFTQNAAVLVSKPLKTSQTQQDEVAHKHADCWG